MGVLSSITGKLRAEQTRWKALVFCLGAAMIFWLLSALNKEHTTDVALPVRISFDHTRYVPVRPLPEKVIVNATGNGWDLLIKSLGYDTEPVVIELDRPDATPYILATSVRSDFANAAGKLNINFFLSDTIRVAIDDLVTRKLKLQAELKGISFSDEYGLHGATVIEPDSVVVTGPEILVDSLPDVLVLNPAKKRISENLDIEVPVILGAGLVVQPSRVLVRIAAGPVVIRTIRLPLNVEKRNSNRKQSNDSIQITLRGPEEIFNSATQSGWHAGYPASGLPKGEFVIPQIFGVPQWVTILQIDSVRVK